MGYTIVYDRRFIRCDQRYIPFCLYGSNNVTQFNPRTGKEVREREWRPFTYGDNMFLATADELMEEVRKYHDGSRIENFKYRGEWLDDEQVIRFFQNGIAGAVTVEDIRAADHECLHCYLVSYAKDGEYLDKRQILNEYFVKTSAELDCWIENAKEDKKKLLDSGKYESVYIEISLWTTRPLNARPKKRVDEPCVLHSKKFGYISEISRSCVRSTPNISEAKQFANSAEAYVAMEVADTRGLVLNCIPVSSIKEKNDRFVLSVMNSNQHMRVYVLKLTRHRLHFTTSKDMAKKFSTEKAALKWYEEHIPGRYSGVDVPAAEQI